MFGFTNVKTASGPEDRESRHPIDYHKLAREVTHYIHEHFKDVGSQFTKEALKMHYGVTEKRNIRGSATSEEEETLKDEGVEFFKIPMIKPDEEDS